MQQPGNAARNANKQINNLNDPYLRCIAGPTTMMSTGMGFPDGDPRKSIVVDFKQTFTINPIGGSIRYALVSSPLGCLALGCGTLTTGVIVPRYTTTTTLAYDWTAINPTVNSAASWAVLPFAENGSYLLNGPNMGAYSINDYRGLVYTADSVFTGSENVNGGVARVMRFNVSPIGTTGLTVNTVAVNRTTYTDMNGSATEGGSARFTCPARESINLRGVSSKPTFRDVIDGNAVGLEVCPFGLTTAGLFTPDLPWCGLDPAVPVTVVEYSGLDPTASITVEVRSCLEMTPRPGSMSAFTKPAPSCNIATWQKVANFARNIPTAVVQGAGKTAYAYLTGGPAAAALAVSGLLAGA